MDCSFSHIRAKLTSQKISSGASINPDSEVLREHDSAEMNQQDDVLVMWRPCMDTEVQEAESAEGNLCNVILEWSLNLIKAQRWAEAMHEGEAGISPNVISVYCSPANAQLIPNDISLSLSHAISGYYSSKFELHISGAAWGRAERHFVCSDHGGNTAAVFVEPWTFFPESITEFLCLFLLY